MISSMIKSGDWKGEKHVPVIHATVLAGERLYYNNQNLPAVIQ